MKVKKQIFIFLLALVILLTGGCSSRVQETAEDTPPGLEGQEQQQAIDDADEEGVQIDLQEENILGGILKNRDNKPIILSFWVSWDEESKEQLDILENVYKLLEDEVVFIGIHATSFDTVSKEEITEYIADKGYSFDIIADEDGEINQAYYVGSFPTTVFLDREEKVVTSYTALIQEDEILDEIEAILESLLE